MSDVSIAIFTGRDGSLTPAGSAGIALQALGSQQGDRVLQVLKLDTGANEASFFGPIVPLGNSIAQITTLDLSARKYIALFGR
jgi:hypothetical protein